ncbi:MAG TPA: DUF742 domain-containing protein [Pseudonocardiaceae bacterium]|jgi:hypothetical protein|nr:DUF742 domain-containing protein [Pseudonocardiaceae bacterium]
MSGTDSSWDDADQRVPPGSYDDDAEDRQTFGDVMNGFSFDSGRGRRKRKKADRARHEQQPEQHEREQDQPREPRHERPRELPRAQAPEPPAERDYPNYSEYSAYPDHLAEQQATDTQPWPAPRVRNPPPPRPALSNPPTHPSLPLPAYDPAYDGGADHGEDDAPARVRAYAWTRGRTQSQFKLEVETLLTTSAQYEEGNEWTQAEYHAVASLCQQPRSVAEVAALLSLPLGVAKVLLGDMAGSGLLVVHETASTDGQGPDLALMERILSGLRRL